MALIIDYICKFLGLGKSSILLCWFSSILLTNNTQFWGLPTQEMDCWFL